MPLLLDALRDLPRVIHAGFARQLNALVRGMHYPLKVTPGVLVCRTCRHRGVPMNWPCPTISKYETQLGPDAYRQFVRRAHGPVSGEPPRLGVWCGVCDVPWPCPAFRDTMSAQPRPDVDDAV